MLVVRNPVLATQHGEGWRPPSGDTFITASAEAAGDGLGQCLYSTWKLRGVV